MIKKYGFFRPNYLLQPVRRLSTYLLFLLVILYTPITQAQNTANVNFQQTQSAPTSDTHDTQKTNLPAGAQLVEPTKIDPKNDKEEPNIFLNFENASLLSVVNYLGDQKKINLTPDPKAQKDLEAAKVTLTTREPLTLDRAWDVLLTLLEMNKFSIMEVGKMFRVVPSDANGFEPLPTYSSETGTAPEDLPNNSLIIRYIYFFKTIKAEGVAEGILKSMLDEKGVRINKELNCCIIKEQSCNIKAAMRILKELDVNGLREQIKIIPLRYTDADTIFNLFKDILQQKEEKTISFAGPSQQERTYFSSTTKMYPDVAKNQLILLGTEKNLDKVTDFIYKNIDVPQSNAENRLHIYELRYQDAQTILPVIKGVVSDVKAPTDKTTISGEYKYFEDVIISAEKSNEGTSDKESVVPGSGNRLIIACGTDDWRRIKEFIRKLDKPQPQIALEILFIDVENNLTKALGAQTYSFKGKPNLGLGTATAEFVNLGKVVHPAPVPPANPGPNYGLKNYMLLTQENESSPAGAGKSYMTLGRPGSTTAVDPKTGDPLGENIWSIVQATYNLSNSNVVSQPYVVTGNNQKCEVTVSDEYTVTGALEGTAAVQPIVKQAKVRAALSVVITPRINLDGVVDLTVKVDDSDIVQNPANKNLPTILTRNLTTRSTLLSGEVLVLGGLTKTQNTDNTYSTPILGQLPLIGNLFRYKSSTQTITNLYIFIRPSIIKPKFDGGADEYTQLKLDYAKYQMMKNDTYATDTDPIQRWFFKPTTQSAKQALLDRSKGVFRPIDDFAYAKSSPKTIKMDEDPYFRVQERIEEVQKKRSRSRSNSRSRRRSRSAAKPTTIKLT